jgi:hypothetical protein
MSQKLSAADAPDGYWTNPALEKLDHKWVFEGVKTRHKTLGEALTYDAKFMENYLYNEADYYVQNINDEAIFNEWLEECKWKVNRAGFDNEQDWIAAYTERANKQDKDAIFQWAHERISNDVPDYWEQIRDMCRDWNGALRPYHPIVACHQLSRDEDIELADIRGWCPSCNEPLTQGDLTIGGDLSGEPPLVSIEVFHCGNCGAVDPINGFEEKFDRPFHLPTKPMEMKLNEENNSANRSEKAAD